jgi:hypothetical protein
MKKIFLGIILTGFLFSCGTKTSEDKSSKKSENVEGSIEKESFNEKMKRYEVKSGIIEYQTSTEGNVMGFKIEGEGTKKVVFKDWGAVELVEEKKTENNMGQRSKTHNLSKFDNGITYSVNFDDKKILKGDQKGMFNTLTTSHDNMAEAGKSMLESMGGKKIGEDKIQSYECEIWEVMGQKVWLYKGLTLRMEVNVMGIKTIEEAIMIKLNSSIDSEDLNLPDFPVMELEGMQMPALDNEEKENLNKIKKMSFEEFKEMAKEEEELKNMAEKELKQTFEMMKKMAEMMPQ